MIFSVMSVYLKSCTVSSEFSAFICGKKKLSRFPHDIRQRLDEQPGRVQRFRALEIDPQLPGMLPVDDVDIVQRFHVVAGKADGDLEHVPVSLARDPVQRRFHLGLKPGLGRARAFALPCDSPVLEAESVDNKADSLLDLLFVRVARGYIPDRDAVAGE